jgi:hypothetical protein
MMLLLHFWPSRWRKEHSVSAGVLLFYGVASGLAEGFLRYVDGRREKWINTLAASRSRLYPQVNKDFSLQADGTRLRFVFA